MPLKIWDSPTTVERAPLSTPNQEPEEDEEGSFVPYSDRATESSASNRHNSQNNKVILVEEDEPQQRKSDYSDDYRDSNSTYEDEYGDLSYTNRAFANTAKRHYRSSLICAYIKHCFQNRVLRRICSLLFFLTVMLIMIFCASAIGYIISQEGNPFVSDGNEDGKSSNFIPPTPNLFNICNDWVTNSGRQNCQRYCDNAKCCSLPETDKDSCWKEHAEDCATYRSACLALELHTGVVKAGGDASNKQDSSGGVGSLASVVDLPAPPVNLIDICSTVALSTPEGFNTCSEICRPSRCCNPNLYDCQLRDESSKSYCAEYDVPCRNVAETWRGSGHGDVGGGESKSVASQIVAKCNAANLNPPDDCIEACRPGACCYVSETYPPIEQLFDNYYGADQNPIKTTASCSSNVGFCQQYGSCDHLNQIQDISGLQNDDFTYELQIDNVCVQEYIAKNGALSCNNVCQPSHCCFSQDQSCNLSQLGDLNCDKYAQCKVLYPEQKNIGELLQLAEHINEVCSDALSSLVSRSNCQDQCKGHLCCFDDGAYGCSNDSAQNCLAYAACEILVETPQSALNQNNQVVSSTSTTSSSALNKSSAQTSIETVENAITDIDGPVSLQITPDFSTLTEVCNEKYMMAKDVEDCASLCKEYECCFAGDNCNLSSSTCSRVAPCQNYFVPQDEEVAIEKQCSKDVIDKDPDSCLAICEPYNCCFTDKQQCSEHIATDCGLYTPCKILLDNSAAGNFIPGEMTDDNPKIESDPDDEISEAKLEEFCAPSQLGNNWNACISYCEPYECCFSDSTPCIKSKTQCGDHSICAQFFSNPVSTASTITTSTEPPNNDGPSYIQYTAVELAQACNSKQLEKDPSDCKLLCKGSACCFSSYSSSNCFDRQKPFCHDHAICESVFDR